MHVVAKARAIGGWVVGAVEFQMRALARRDVDGHGDEVRLRVMILADRAVFGCAGGIKIAEDRETEAGRRREGFEGNFDVELGLAVGVNGNLRKVLVDGQRRRHAKGRARRGEDKFLHAHSEHRVEQVQGGRAVVEVVFDGVGDGFADVTEGREMHDRFDFLGDEDVFDGDFVT